MKFVSNKSSVFILSNKCILLGIFLIIIGILINKLK